MQTADALQIKGLEKNNDLLSPYLGPTRLLSVPSHQVCCTVNYHRRYRYKLLWLELRPSVACRDGALLRN
jgi:hypothetical protein